MCRREGLRCDRGLSHAGFPTVGGVRGDVGGGCPVCWLNGLVDGLGCGCGEFFCDWGGFLIRRWELRGSLMTAFGTGDHQLGILLVYLPDFRIHLARAL